MRVYLAWTISIAIAAPATASDIGASRQKAPDEVFQSSKSIFDVERCLIDMDGPGIPSVYRQPDRPEKSMIAYGNGTGVPLLIELTGSAEGTKVEVRRRTIGMMRAGVPQGVAACI